jgi:hypothetical protein
LDLSVEEASVLHEALEQLLESQSFPRLERVHRLLSWRLAAASDETASGLTAELARLAREASTLEEYEAARDRVLGPILERLESPENRDP